MNKAIVLKGCKNGVVANNQIVGAFDVDISGGTIRLLVTPASSSSTIYTVNFVATKI